MSVITRFHIQNFKAFRDSTPIDITPFTLIVGPNGSGKTSILEAFEFIMSLNSFRKNKIPKTSPRLNKKLHNQDLFIFMNDIKKDELMCRMNPSQIKKIEELIELEWLQHSKTNTPTHNENIASNLLKIKSLETITYISPNFSQKRLKIPCYDDNETPSLQEDGYGLASVIANMMTSDPDAFLQLQEAVRNVLPSIKRIRTRRAKVEESHIEILRVDGAALERPVKRELIGSELIFDTVSGDNIPASDMSEGAMIVLALLTEILRPGGASLLLIDDLERGIHPGALQNFVAQLRALFEVRPDLQIIATTHSPYLVTEFAREEILMTTLDDEGYALCAPMTANDQWDKWKDIAVTGEFWGIIGEDWIKELRKNA